MGKERGQVKKHSRRGPKGRGAPGKREESSNNRATFGAGKRRGERQIKDRGEARSSKLSSAPGESPRSPSRAPSRPRSGPSARYSDSGQRGTIRASQTTRRERDGSNRRGKALGGKQMDLCYGRRPVFELLRVRPSQIKMIYTAESAQFEPALTEVLQGIQPLHRVRMEELDRLADGGNHQGIVAILRPPIFATEEEVVQRALKRGGVICLLDQINDPHNFGAILRVCEAVGVDGVLVPERRNAPVSAVVRKSSAGASELLPIAIMKNMQRTINQLKKSGFWIVGAQVGKSAKPVWRLKFPERVALILGSEGEGLRHLTERECDELVEIPMFGRIDSLNVSQAAAVLLYELKRQRSKG